MGPSCPLKPTGRWLVSSHGLEGQESRVGTPLDSFVLGSDGEGVSGEGLGHHRLLGYRDPWSSLDVGTHLTCLLSWKILFSPAVLIKAMGVCAQVGEGTVPHTGLWTFIFFLT